MITRFNPIQSPDLTPSDFFLWEVLAERNVWHQELRQKLNTPAHQSQQQIWWLHVSQLLMTVNYAMKPRVVIFNTCFRFANSARTHTDACDSVYYVTLC